MVARPCWPSSPGAVHASETVAPFWALMILLAWPAQILRLRLRGFDWTRAIFLTFGKLPEALGVLGYHVHRLTGAERRLIEYK